MRLNEIDDRKAMAAALLTLCDALVLSPTAAPLRSAAQQPVSRAGPTMIPALPARRAALHAEDAKPPKLGRGGKGPGMSDGGEGGGGEGGGGRRRGPATRRLQPARQRVEGVRRSSTKPLLMKMATSATGSSSATCWRRRASRRPRVRLLRLFRLASFGFLVHGSTSHWFYGMLDGKIPGTSAGVVASKVFIDQVLWNPIFGIMFCTSLSSSSRPRLRRRQGPERIDDAGATPRAIRGAIRRRNSRGAIPRLPPRAQLLDGRRPTPRR